MILPGALTDGEPISNRFANRICASAKYLLKLKLNGRYQAGERLIVVAITVSLPPISVRLIDNMENIAYERNEGRENNSGPLVNRIE